MNALFEPARAGFVVLACLLAACSGATEPETDSSSRTGGDSRTVAVPSPAPTPAPTSTESTEPPSDSAASPTSSGGSGAAGTGAALCGPDELCRGISSCTNSCYGPNCCAASCQCRDIHAPSSHLFCSLSCPK